VSSIAKEWQSLHARVLQHRAQLALSLRVTIAAVSGFLLALLLHLPLPLWTVLTAVILTQVNFGRTLKATIDYLVGTIGGAVYAGAVAAVVPPTNAGELAGVLAVAVAPLALLGAIVPSFSAATFTGVMVLFLPGITHVGPVESAFFRVLEVAAGGPTALAVSLLVLPARAHSLVIETAAQMLELAAQALPDLFAGFVQSCDTVAMGHVQDRLGQTVARLDAIAAEARHEQLRFLGAEPDPARLRRTLLRLRHDLVMIGRAGVVPLPETLQSRLGPLLARVADTSADYLRRSAKALAARRGPPPLDAAEAALDDCAEAFVAIRREGLTHGLRVDAVERVFTLAFALEQVRRDLRDLGGCVRETARRK
jgi:uncharacterized membrane protein YccC